MAFAPRLVTSEPVARTTVFDVERLSFDDAGQRFIREVVRHPGAVAVLAFDGQRVLVVRQWRAPLGREILEIPAGTCDVDGEDPEATARRELQEEAGWHAGRLEPLYDVWNSPGWSDQRTRIYLATDLTPTARRPSGPEEEAIEVVWLTIDDAIGLLDAPGPVDASTALAIRQLVARLRP